MPQDTTLAHKQLCTSVCLWHKGVLDKPPFFPNQSCFLLQIHRFFPVWTWNNSETIKTKVRVLKWIINHQFTLSHYRICIFQFPIKHKMLLSCLFIRAEPLIAAIVVRQWQQITVSYGMKAFPEMTDFPPTCICAALKNWRICRHLKWITPFADRT